MSRKNTLVVAVATLLTLLGGAEASADETTYYVSVGDSAAAGIQPSGVTNAGYADQLAQRMRSRFPDLRLVKLGCPGETTASLTSGSGSPCSYRAGSQLKQAVRVLRAHPGQIAFVTVNVGVNDVLDVCMDETGAIAPDCVRDQLPRVRRNLATIVNALRNAAPGAPIAGMSYWNPFLGFWVMGHDGKELARTSDRAMRALNAGLVETYRNRGAKVADVAGPAYFDIGDFYPMVDTWRWGTIPANVAKACRLTWFCEEPPVGPDPHPNTKGYGVIASAFVAVL